MHFFSSLPSTERKVHGVPNVNLVVVTMNANRDHTTELSSNLSEKEVQREVFKRIVDASKYQVCAALAADYSTPDAEGYKVLAEKAMSEIREIDGLVTHIGSGVAKHCGFADEVAVWQGGTLMSSYPRQYALRRRKWHHALSNGSWEAALEILDAEYKWRQGDWYNFGRLVREGDNDDDLSARPGVTLVHILATSTPPAEHDAKEYRAWKLLTEGAAQPHVWSLSLSSVLCPLRLN